MSVVVGKLSTGGFQSALLDAADQAVIITDAQRTIVYWNAAAERLYGWTAEERLGRNLLGDTAAVAGPATEVLAGVERGGAWAGEFPVPHKDGDIVPAFITMAPLQGRGGRLDGVLGISFDRSKDQATHAGRAALAASLARRVVEAHARRLRPAGVSLARTARDGVVMLAVVAAATLVRAALGALATDVAPFGAYYLAVLPPRCWAVGGLERSRWSWPLWWIAISSSSRCTAWFRPDPPARSVYSCFSWPPRGWWWGWNTRAGS